MVEKLQNHVWIMIMHISPPAKLDSEKFGDVTGFIRIREFRENEIRTIKENRKFP